jgi:hypothetical protein
MRRLLLLAAIMLAACSEDRRAPLAQTYVLVDLSATWHSTAQDQRNLRLLGEVGQAITLASGEIDGPHAIEYRSFGEASLARPPICDVIFTSTVAPIRVQDEHVITRSRELGAFLGSDCPRRILASPPEQLTEVSAAVTSVAGHPAAGATRRNLIILSDFLEETRRPMPLQTRLDGFRILLIYRPVAADMANPETLRARMQTWEQTFRQGGATVTSMPDDGLHRSAIADFLTAAAASR